MIFDLDGTLIDSKNAIIESMNTTLKHFKLPEKSSHEISSYIGRGVEELIKESAALQDTALLNEIESFFAAHFRRHANERSRLFPHVSSVLEYFKQKKKIIITNRKYAIALHDLEHFHIAHYFVDIIGGDDLTCMKPSSCPIDRVINNYTIDSQKTIIIGDMAIDIMAGKNAHIITCAFNGGIGKVHDIKSAEPDYIIDDINQLKNIIK